MQSGAVRTGRLPCFASASFRAGVFNLNSAVVNSTAEIQEQRSMAETGLASGVGPQGGMEVIGEEF
jgi:hypothetical protein